MNGNEPAATRPTVKLLQLQYEGYFMCRIATDPDPTNEERGVSGYTLALVGEPALDQVIRLQEDEVSRKLREPAGDMGIRIGVKVTGVQFDGAAYAPGEAVLMDAPVSLKGRSEFFDGPIFDSRNNILGSDDNMMFVIHPFCMEIVGKGVTLVAEDHLNPADPQQKIWEIEDPSTYARRLPVSFSPASTEVMAQMRVFDQFTYFNDRLRYLRQRIAELERSQDPAREAEIEALRTRVYQIEFWGDRFFSKMAYQLNYDFRINGPQKVEGDAGALKGALDTAHPWLARFWFGGWDGDLLVGYMQGTLGIPFRPDSTPSP